MTRVLAFAVSVACILASACGSSPATPTAPATLIVNGSLNAQGCQAVSLNGLLTCQTFSGVLTNTGSGCAGNVHGNTITYVVGTTLQAGSSNWTYSNRIRPGENVTYSGGPITVAAPLIGGWTFATTPQWDNVGC